LGRDWEDAVTSILQVSENFEGTVHFEEHAFVNSLPRPKTVVE